MSIRNEKACPSCGKELPTEQGMKMHHTRVHGESLVTEATECGQCSDRIEYYPSQGEPEFCDRECYAEAQQDRWAKENHPDWKGGKIELVCEWCEERFTVKQSRADTAQFCSRSCYHKWMRENSPIGAKHPSWKEDSVDNYGEGWFRARRIVRERDSATCQCCGVNESEEIIDVHHIIPYRKFEKDREANDPENLICLCRSCHMKVESGKKDCPEPEIERTLINSATEVDW